MTVQNEKSKIVYPVFEKSRKKSDNFTILKKNYEKLKITLKFEEYEEKFFSGTSSKVYCTPNLNKKYRMNYEKKLEKQIFYKLLVDRLSALIS